MTEINKYVKFYHFSIYILCQIYIIIYIVNYYIVMLSLIYIRNKNNMKNIKYDVIINIII